MGGAAVTPTAELTQAVVDATTALVMLLDRDGAILLANPAMERFTGQAEAELIGRPFWEVYVTPEDLTRAQQAVGAALTDGASFLDEGTWFRGDGVRRQVSMQNSVVTDDAGRPRAMAVVAIDVTEQRQREALVQRKATTDALTGTWNRGFLFDALQQHLDPDTGRGCALLFADVDHFKAVNDQHGHARGDQLLVEVASRLLQLAGPEDLVARFGGDEFVLLVPDVAESELAALVDRARSGMRVPVHGATVPFSVSIGGAHGRPGDYPDHVLALADQSMYRRKRRRT